MAFGQSPRVDPAPIAVPAGPTEVQVCKAVKAVLGRSWTVADNGRAAVNGSPSRDNSAAKIRADDSNRQAHIRYVDSTNLKYEIKRDGTRLIQSNYLNGLTFLNDDIGRDMELLFAANG